MASLSIRPTNHRSILLEFQPLKENKYFNIMIYTIIIAVIAYLIYLSVKGNADIKNVNKHGGLRNKYRLLIDRIMARNSFYQLKQINSNNIELTNTGMKFKLIELDKKLQVTWHWTSFVAGKTYKLQWYFNEFEDQDKMYEILDKDMAIQSLIDDGMTKPQAVDLLKINRSNNEDEKERLVKEFSSKHPELWSKITG